MQSVEGGMISRTSLHRTSIKVVKEDLVSGRTQGRGGGPGDGVIETLLAGVGEKNQ